MDTQPERERIARIIEICADEIRNLNSDSINDANNLLFQMTRGGGEIDRLARLVAESEYYECDVCGSDFHREDERYGAACANIADYK